MLAFVIRRLVIAVPILILSTMLAFVLVTISGDPLDDLRQQLAGTQAAVAEARRSLDENETEQRLSPLLAFLR